MIRVEKDVIHVETRTLTARLEGGALTSLVSRITGESMLQPFDRAADSPLRLVYRNADDTVRIDEPTYSSAIARRISDHRAEVRLQSWDADGMITVSEDEETGDLIIEPSAYSSRPGVRSCRWTLRGIPPDMEVVGPSHGGIKVKLNDPLVTNIRWEWPMFWEAGFVILQRPGSGFWVHTQDDRFRYKGLKFSPNSDVQALGFDTEAYGPLDENVSAGGLAWRINVFQGDWRVPVARYREWLWKTYHLQAELARRPGWLGDLALSVNWCPNDGAILDAVARRVKPQRVLVHVPGWRGDGYDQNYPTYAASEAGRAFVAKARSMGFRVAPHFNTEDVDPQHPCYDGLDCVRMQNIETRKAWGWAYAGGKILGPPNAGHALRRNRDKNVMVKIHPGSAMWRSVLAEHMEPAVREFDLEAVFADVTLCTGNLHNCLVDGLTSTEGMRLMIERLASIKEGLVVGGEGINEIVAQKQAFGMTGAYYVFGRGRPHIARTGGLNLGHVLWGDLCRAIGHGNLSGKTPDEEATLRVLEEHDGLPTITVGSAQEILEPNPVIERVLEKAGRT